MDDMQDALHALRTLIDLLPGAYPTELDVIHTKLLETHAAIREAWANAIAPVASHVDRERVDAAWRVLMAAAAAVTVQGRQAGYRVPAMAV